MSKNKDAMTPARWNHIKSLGHGVGKMVHKSCDAGTNENPLDPMLPRVPWVTKGVTFKPGRNARKRETRNTRSNPARV